MAIPSKWHHQHVLYAFICLNMVIIGILKKWGPNADIGISRWLMTILSCAQKFKEPLSLVFNKFEKGVFSGTSLAKMSI